MEEAVWQLYSGLPGSEVPTGVLYDRAMPIVDAKQFDGTGNAPVMTRQLWWTAYRDLYAAAYETRGMEAPDDIAAAVTAAPEDVVPILISYIGFNELGYGAYDDYRLDYDDANDTFVRGSNGASPYVGHAYFAAALGRSRVHGTDVTFLVDLDYYTTNQNQAPAFFRIDFGDGAGSRRVDWGEQVTVYYGDIGVKEVHVEAIFSDAMREARFELVVAPPHVDLDCDSEITNLEAEAEYEGEIVPYEYCGIYGQDGNMLDKPIVLLDGIDFGDMTGTEDPRGVEDIIDMFDNQVTLSDGVPRRALSDLHLDGYDIFVLNYKDGADHIRRNAFALVDLLENIINERTGGREQIVVVGPSMGGVVSRYALSYMEHTGREHNVRLFISYDSPQLGANVTVGLQQMIDAFPKVLRGQVADRRAMLERPAAKELDLYYALDGVNDVHPLRQQLLSELEAYGNYPDDERLTKVAVANGSGYGNPQHGKNGRILEPSAHIFRLTIKGVNALSGVGYDYEADIYAAPNRAERVVFQGDRYVTVVYRRIRIKIKPHATRKLNTPPYDSAPGGYRDFAGAAVTAANADNKGLRVGLALLGYPTSWDAETDFPLQSFIPTVSALAYNTLHPSPYDPYDQDYYYPVMQDAESERRARSPFDDLVAHQGNTRHVQVTPTSYAFVMRHIYHVDEEQQLAGQTFNDPEPAFTAKQTITAENTTVKSGAELSLRAGESIVLRSGFKVEAGATFSARIDPALQDAGSPPLTSAAPAVASAGSLQEQGIKETSSRGKRAGGEGGEGERPAAKTLMDARGSAVPVRHSLSDNYPNPFRRYTQVRYGLPADAHVKITVYDLLGRHVKTLVNAQRPAGHHRVRFDATALASGTYLCRLEAGDFVATRTMLLVK